MGLSKLDFFLRRCENVFPFVNTDVAHSIELEKNGYNIAVSNADAGHDLWAFWHDNMLGCGSIVRGRKRKKVYIISSSRRSKKHTGEAS